MLKYTSMEIKKKKLHGNKETNCMEIKKTRLQSNRKYPLFLWVKVIQNVAQFPLHHVTYAPIKTEVAT